MLPEEIASLVLEGHLKRKSEILNVQGFNLEPQLDYSGLMATGGYKGWKEKRNSDRPKVGCFDFKIYKYEGNERVPVNHLRTLKKLKDISSKDTFEHIFSGKDPSRLGLDEEEFLLVEEVQLEMVEQEINWGDEVFQSWSNFLPSEGKRPRDFLMAYVRRLFEEPDYLSLVEKKRAASGTFGTLPSPTGKEWRPYLEPKGSPIKPWLTGKLLKKFRNVASSMPDNPKY
jgi:hypothetical protein